MTTLYGYVSNTDTQPSYADITNSDMSKAEKVAAIKQRSKNYNDDLDEQLKKELMKQYAGAALQIGSAAIPAMGVGRVGLSLAKPLASRVGQKIAQEIVSGAGTGAISGAVEGIGRGLVDGENPLKTAAYDSIIGLLTGGGAGYAGGKIGQNIAKKGLVGNPEAQAKYYDDYIDGVANNFANIREARALKSGNYGNEQGSLLFDKISPDEFKKWFGSSKIVDDFGNPKLFKDNDNVFITDGYSNNGISRYTYKGGHRAPSYSQGDVLERIKNSDDVNLSEVAKGYHNQPQDYFTAMGPRYYGYNDTEGIESLNAVRQAINGKDKIMAYRAVPKDVNSEILNNGDWVTLSPNYAKMHGETNLNDNYKIIKQEVPTNHLWWDGNDIREWGYDNGLPTAPDIMIKMDNPYYADAMPDNWMEARKIRDLGYDGIIAKDGNYLVFEKDQLKRTSDVDGDVAKAYNKALDTLNFRDEWVKINGKDYRVLNLPKKDYGKILHIVDTYLKPDDMIGETLNWADDMYKYTFKKTSPTDYKFIKRRKIK